MAPSRLRSMPLPMPSSELAALLQGASLRRGGPVQGAPLSWFNRVLALVWLATALWLAGL